MGIDVKDERRVRLDRIAKEEGEAFVYEYDMGDSWQHQVLVEKVGADSSEARGAICLSGERACPPEDCGGVHGYYGTLEILRNPRHDEYKHIKTWIESMTGGPFDPDSFDLEAVNAALKALRDAPAPRAQKLIRRGSSPSPPRERAGVRSRRAS